MKKSIKKAFALFSAVLMIFTLAACGGGENEKASKTDDEETKILKVAFNQTDRHPQYQAIVEFGKAFNERTDGRYKVEIYPSELLGAQRETVELVQSGTIAMSIVAGPLMENLNPDFSIFNLPYVFNSVDHQMSIINDPEIVSDLYESLRGDKIDVVAAFHGGVRNVYNSKKAINTPEDLAGMKIRVMESDTNVQMMKYMGGTGTPMGQGEVYTAIQSGVLEGGENNELVFNDLKHVEIAPYYSYTQHLMIPDYLIINSDLLSGMTEEDQKAFHEELAKAIESEVAMFDEQVERAKEEAEEAGAKFNEVDLKAFQEAVQPLIDEKTGANENTKQIYEKIKSKAQ
jgi:tripartite ATP-independent transporter DctP family solute receptor